MEVLNQSVFSLADFSLQLPVRQVVEPTIPASCWMPKLKPWHWLDNNISVYYWARASVSDTSDDGLTERSTTKYHYPANVDKVIGWMNCHISEISLGIMCE